MKSKINNQSPCDRLNAVLLKYFITQKNLAQIIGISPNNLGAYTRNINTITEKFAMLLQTKAGINADYILNGNEPMMLANVEPKYAGDVPVRNKTKTKYQPQYDLKKHFVVKNEGKKRRFIDMGQTNINSFVFIEQEKDNEEFIVSIHTQEFEAMYGLAMFDVLIIHTEYEEGDYILFVRNDNCYIGKYNNGEVVEVRSGEVDGINDVKVIGAIYKKIVNINFE